MQIWSVLSNNKTGKYVNIFTILDDMMYYLYTLPTWHATILLVQSWSLQVSLTEMPVENQSSFELMYSWDACVRSDDVYVGYHDYYSQVDHIYADFLSYRY